MEPNNPDAAEVRLSNAERDVVISQLKQATDEGRISLVEFEERAGKAYAAQFPSELIPLTKDLPSTPESLPAPVVDVHATPVRRARRWYVSIMGGSDRRGKWDPGEETRAVTLMGGQTFDLTDVEADEVNIVAFTLMGGTEIIVPGGAQVDLGGFMLFGGSSNDANRAGSSTMSVRVRAWGGMGACQVRNLRPREIRERNR